MTESEFKQAEAEHLTPLDKIDVECWKCERVMTLSDEALRECFYCFVCCDEMHAGRCGK